MCTILIAEDNKSLRDSLKNFLCAEGFDVLAAENGVIALKLAEITDPDIILSDVHMPVMDGYELLRKIRENPHTSSTPLVFLTSDIEVDRTKAGSEDVVYKPFVLNDLLELIKLKIEYVKKNRVKQHHKTNLIG